jgi:hypothetical protein
MAGTLTQKVRAFLYAVVDSVGINDHTASNGCPQSSYIVIQQESACVKTRERVTLSGVEGR